MWGRSVNPGPEQLSARGRSLIAFGAFAIGIDLALRLPGVVPLVWFGLACAVAGLSMAMRGRRAPAVMAAALGLLGAGVSASHLGPWPEESLALALPGEDEPQLLIEVEGLVASRPERYEPRPGALSAFVPKYMRTGERTRFDLDVRRVRAGDEWRAASGVLTVWADMEDGALSAGGGDFVRLTGSASASGPPMNPGEFDRRLQSRDTHRVGWISTSAELVEKALAQTPWERFESRVLSLRFAVQSRAAGIIDRATRGDEVAGPVIRGLILGATGRDDPGVAEAFRRVGLLHLLSVSGFHVAVAAGVALLAIRVTGDRGWVEPMVVCLALGLYVMIVPMRSPIFRAAVMLLALLVGDALGRRHDRISVVCWVGIVWLMIRPGDLFALGFQLSFGLTAWLMLISEPRRDDIPILGEASRAEMIAFVFRKMVRTHVSTWSLAMPAIVYHTGIVSPLAVLASVVTVPMIVVSMWLGFLVLGLGVLVPGLEPWASWALRVSAGASARAVLWFDSVPMATLRVPGASLPWATAATVGVIWIWRRARLRDWRWVAILAGLGVWLAAEVVADRWSRSASAAVHMLAVGDASALVVRAEGAAALWDCGSWRQDVGRSLVPEACRALGVTRADTLFITHANIDHYMGVPDVFQELGVRRVVTGESFARAAARDPDGGAAFVLSELDRLGIEHRVAVAGDVFDIGSATLRILHPPAGFVPRAENDASLVAMLEAEGTPARVLLTGDIQSEAMALLMSTGADVRADVIELPHHGSAHEAAYAFVEHVGPRVVLQSTGRQRLDDARWDDVRVGRTWLVTQRHGMSSVRLMKDGTVRAEAFR